MTSVRTTGSLAGALPEPLRTLFEQQVAVVTPYILAAEPAARSARVGAAMTDVLTTYYGLTPAAANALVRVASHGEEIDAADGALRGAIERCALQRALVSAGFAAACAPYVQAAARGAEEGLALDPVLVLTPLPSSPAVDGPLPPPNVTPVRTLGTTGSDVVGPSPFFAPPAF